MIKDRWIELDGRRIKLTNLEKGLFPGPIVKAEIIRYYHLVAPTMLLHIANRPLTLIRYPDGIEGEVFYQKQLPDWTPDWMESIKVPSADDNNVRYYFNARDIASLIWIANLSALEVHQFHYQQQHHPDYFVFDLDPPDGLPFADIISIALLLKDYLASKGFQTYAKTSGSRGIHLFISMVPHYEANELFEFFKKLIREFIRLHQAYVTLELSKERRKGRILIDIYRNRRYQSIVSPYSIRGRKSAPVSMPLTWTQLENTISPDQYTIHNVPDMLLESGDAWASFGSDPNTISEPSAISFAGTGLLQEYRKKRNLTISPEPGIPGENEKLQASSRFVIHRHASSRLHYDLRLEQDGVLRSWALPKGLPSRPGEKRLAVATEDHPIQYLEFEGEIPKGEYGGGMIWIFLQGSYRVTKHKKDGFYFQLYSRLGAVEYRIHRMQEKEYLMERVSPLQIDWFADPPAPMLASLAKNHRWGKEYIYEVKWDGIRATFHKSNGIVRIYSRNMHDISAQFPELVGACKQLKCTSAIFDGEIVRLNTAGRPDFSKVLSRLHKKNTTQIDRLAIQEPVHAYLFDLIYLDGVNISNEPLFLRRDWLLSIIPAGIPFRFSEALEDGELMFTQSQQLGLEGVMAKKRYSLYEPGKRTENWLKIKHKKIINTVIVGFYAGTDGRKIGALAVAEQANGELIFRGKVGTGFTEKTLNNLAVNLKPGDNTLTAKRNDRLITPVVPEIWILVEFTEYTTEGLLRDPVFKGFADQ